VPQAADGLRLASQVMFIISALVNRSLTCSLLHTVCRHTSTTTTSPWLWTITFWVSLITGNTFVWLRTVVPSDLF